MKPSLHAVDMKTQLQWPRRWALAVACVTFPLICVGGMVTTQSAGMAVPDWPTTYGYNMFAYPISTWWWGPWDLFLEHSHRLLGSLAGLVTIALVVSTMRIRGPNWVLSGSIACLGLVILQGALGGVRVLLDQRTLAMIHGCVGPGFFALAVGYLTGLNWLVRRQHASPSSDEVASISRSTLLCNWGMVLLFYLQLTVGASIRHISATTSIGGFRHLVFLHLSFASIILVIAIIQSGFYLTRTHHPLLVRIGFPLLVMLQICLGVGTWCCKYGIPVWFSNSSSFGNFTVIANSMWQSNLITAHVAVGSLLLSLAASIAIRNSLEANNSNSPSLDSLSSTGAIAVK